jgi:Domain of unknown function (DUF1707)
MAGWPMGPYFLQPSSRDVRVGTAEREQAVQLLSQHLSAGRLELAEFEERVASAYAARTNSDLAALFRDLPGPLPPMAGYPTTAPRRLPRRAILLLLVAIGLVALVTEVAFPPLFLIPICLLVIHRRRRHWAMAGYRRR